MWNADDYMCTLVKSFKISPDGKLDCSKTPTVPSGVTESKQTKRIPTPKPSSFINQAEPKGEKSLQKKFKYFLHTQDKVIVIRRETQV